MHRRTPEKPFQKVRIARLPDGSLRFENDSGVSGCLRGESVELSLPHIAAVTVENLADILEHRITRCYGSTSHFIRLCDGGQVRLAYNDDGQLLELSAYRICARINAEGRVCFSAYRESQP